MDLVLLIFTCPKLSANPKGSLNGMKLNQSEFRIIDSVFEKSSARFISDFLLQLLIFYKFRISDKRYTVPFKKIAYACLGILFKMNGFSVDIGAF